MTGPLLDPDVIRQLGADLAPEDLRHVCQLLVVDARAMLVAMEQAQLANDTAAWRKAAHRLAGGASGLGALPLESAARAMMEGEPGAEALTEIRSLVDGTVAALDDIAG